MPRASRIALLASAACLFASGAAVGGNSLWPDVVTGCPFVFSDVHKIPTCMTGILTDDPAHLALPGEVAPGDGSVGMVVSGKLKPPSDLDHEYSFSGAAMLSGFWAARASEEFRWRIASRDEKETLKISASLRDMPQLDYFGIGPSTIRVASHFAANELQGGAEANYPVTNWAMLLGGLKYDRWRLRGVADTASIERNYTEDTAPGLTRQPDDLEYKIGIFLHGHAGIYDGNVSVNEQIFQDVSGLHTSFQRLDIRVEGSVTFQTSAGLNVGELVGRAMLNAVHRTQSAVPFYYLPTLGGNNIDSNETPRDFGNHGIGGNETLRGFDNYRFRGPYAALAQLEYDRLIVWEWLHGLLVFDIGQVALTSQQLRQLGELRHDYGVGAKIVLGNNRNGLVKAYVAFGGGEGTHILVNMTYPY
jgi:hypothetical protein